MGNTLVGPGVLRDTLEYPPTTEGSIMAGRHHMNNNGSHHYQQHSSTHAAPPLAPLGGPGGFLATLPSVIGIRFRRSCFAQFVLLIGFLSLIIFLQDSLLSLSSSAMKEDGGEVKPVIVVGSEQDLRGERIGGLEGWGGGEYSRVKTVTTATAQDSLLREQQQQKQQQKQQPSPLPSPPQLPQQQQEPSQEEMEERLQEVERLLKDDEEEVDEGYTEPIVAELETHLAEDGVVTSPRINNISNSNEWVGGTKEKTKQWMKTFANLLIGHGPLDQDEEEASKYGEEREVVDDDELEVVDDDELAVVDDDELAVVDDDELAVVDDDEHAMVDDDELAVFIPQIKHQGQDAEIVTLPAVVAAMDVPGQESIPEYQVLSNPIPPPSPPQAQELPLHAKFRWTTSSIEKALDPIQEALSSSSSSPRPQDEGDKISKLEIAQWQQEQDLTECRGQKDFYEHDIENLQHVIDEQESDLRDLRAQVEELKAQAAAFEAELEE